VPDHLATVHAIYEAFGRGDVPAILGRLAENVQWEAWADNHAQRAHVPWLEPRQGRDGASRFFAALRMLRLNDFRVLALLAGGNQVAAEIVIDADLPDRGTRLQDEEMHLWTFDEAGQVVRFRHYVDTAKHIAAAQGGGD
jgi:ketosteroid isomerase-like protein